MELSVFQHDTTCGSWGGSHDRIIPQGLAFAMSVPEHAFSSNIA